MTCKALLAAAMLVALGAAACTASRADSQAGAPPTPSGGGPGFGPVSPAEHSADLDMPSPSSAAGRGAR